MSVFISLTFHAAPSLPFSVDDVVDAFRRKWPEKAVTDVHLDDSAMSFSVDGTAVVLGHMPAPVPWRELEPIVESSLLWPMGEQEEALKAHGSHVVVTVTGDLEPVAAYELLTRVTWAVLAADEQSLGVHWHGAEMVVQKAIFNDFVDDVLPEGPPILIWIKISLGPSPEGRGMAGFTTGMAAFSHMELETLDANETPEELMDRFASLAGYLIENGAIIEDGHTIGNVASEKIQVVFSPSSFGRDETVMLLKYGDSKPKKPWWKFW